MSGGPLHGVRVVDLTHALAGPYATMMLADLGADVIKIEPPDGDMARGSGPTPSDNPPDGYGGYFQSINRGKRSVVLDLKTVEGAAALRALVTEADVLVENFTEGVMDRLGLSYESLREHNPRLVYAAVRGFGDARSGASPYQKWPAFDLVVQAMAGIMGITGTDDGTPFKVGPGIGDIFPGTMLALGITSALYEARASGKGQFVDVAMYDAVLSLCERIVYQHSYTGVTPRPEGNRHPLLSPFDILPAADGWVAVAAPNNSRWQLLCELIGRPDLAADPDLATNQQRVARRDEVFTALADWSRPQRKAEILDRLGGRVPVGPVRDAAEIVADPHVAAREMLVELEHPGTRRKFAVAGQPLKFSRTPARPTRRAPLLDEHGKAVRDAPASSWTASSLGSDAPAMDSRVILVTGGSRGIGAGITTALSRRGCCVACSYHTNRDQAEKVASHAPDRIAPVHYDMRNQDSAHDVVTDTVQRFGRLDALVLNAGVWTGGRLGDLDPDTWWGVVESNLRGTVSLVRAALPQLKNSPAGSILFLSSVVGITGNAGDTAYSSAKAAVVGLARSLAKELAVHGIRVNVLAPGFIDTDMTSAVSEKSRAKIHSATVLRRFGTVDEVALAAAFLIEDATYCTGTILTVDGGWSL